MYDYLSKFFTMDFDYFIVSNHSFQFIIFIIVQGLLIPQRLHRIPGSRPPKPSNPPKGDFKPVVFCYSVHFIISLGFFSPTSGELEGAFIHTSALPRDSSLPPASSASSPSAAQFPARVNQPGQISTN